MIEGGIRFHVGCIEDVRNMQAMLQMAEPLMTNGHAPAGELVAYRCGTLKWDSTGVEIVVEKHG